MFTVCNIYCYQVCVCAERACLSVPYYCNCHKYTFLPGVRRPCAVAGERESQTSESCRIVRGVARLRGSLG